MNCEKIVFHIKNLNKILTVLQNTFQKAWLNVMHNNNTFELLYLCVFYFDCIFLLLDFVIVKLW